MAATVATVGQGREKPSVYFKPIAHATSNSPAATSTIHDIRCPSTKERRVIGRAPGEFAARIAQNALLTVPPSTRSAAPVVADDLGLATNATSDATSSGVAKRLMSEVGRTFSKNSRSNCGNDLPSDAARASTKSTTPRDLVGPGSTLLTVMPVPATDSARPRESASCAVLVMP